MIYSGTKDGINFGFYLEREGLKKVVELTEERHKAIFYQQSKGKVITWDNDGKIIIKDPPAPTKKELNQPKIESLKERLKATDYIVVKIAEGVATKESYKKELAERSELREKIRALADEDSA